MFGKNLPMDKEIREKLLKAAEEIFALKGFKEAGIREITRKAGCNVAAVNYYFGSKKNLYLTVVKELWLPRSQRLREEFLKRAREKKDLGGVIEALADAFFSSPFSEEEIWRHRRLLAHELVHSTEALNIMVKEGLIPFFEAVRSHLVSLAPKGVSEKSMKMAVLSILGQIIYFNLVKPIAQAFVGELSERDIKEHIKHLSLKGLEGLEKETGSSN